MNVLAPLARDRVNRYVWAGLLVASALLLVFAIGGERASIGDEEHLAQGRAVRYTETTLFRNLDAQLVSGPILRGDFDRLFVPVQAEILTHDDVARVRLFDESGSLLFSTDELDPTTATVDLGSAFGSAVQGETTSVLVPAGSVPPDGLAGSNEDLYESFVPLRVPGVTEIVGVAEIDSRHALLVAAGRSPWRALEVAFGIGVLATGALTVISFRRPLSPTIDLASTVPTPRVDPGGDDPAQLRQELAEARSQLRQAEEVFRFREAQRSKTDESALRAEVAQLREALAAAEASADRARADAARAKGAESARVQELEDELIEEQLRRANVEGAAQEAERAADHKERERALELERVRDELDGVRAQLEAARFEARAAAADVERIRQEHAEERANREAASAERDDAAQARARPPRPPAKRRPAKARTTKATTTKATTKATTATKSRRSTGRSAPKEAEKAEPSDPAAEEPKAEERRGAPGDPAA